MLTDGLIISISIVLVGVVLVATYFFKSRSEKREKEGQPSNNKGCSIAFYVFLGIVLVGLVLAYIFYRWWS